MNAPELISFVRTLQLPLGREKDMQREMANALEQEGVEHEREHRLSAHDVVDFMLPNGIAVECKLRGQRKAIYKQLRRYALHDSVREIVLVTNTSMGLPAHIEGKPAYYASLGTAWL